MNGTKHWLGSIYRLVSISRPYNALLPCLAVILGFVAANGSQPWQLVLAITAFVLVHSSTTIWNDYEDRAIDEINGVASFSVGSGSRTRYKVVAACAAMLVGTLVCMLFLPLLTNFALVALVVCGWTYNAAPLRLSRRPVASIVVLFLAYGILPFCIGVGLGHVNGHELLPIVLLGLGWGLLRASLSLLKDYKDAAGDAAFGKRTFLLRYGATKVWQYSIGLCATGFVLVIVAVWLLGVSIAGLAALAAVAGWLLYERTALIGKNKSYLELNQTFHKCLHYQLIFDSLVLVWLVS